MEADEKTSFATAAGYSVGTLNYMSPEQATASNVDGRSDLFNLGCTMYHLLTGAVPYPGETVVECLRRRAQPKAVPITDLRPDLPARLLGVLDKLMAHQIEDRYQTAAEAALALQSLAADGRKVHVSTITEPSAPPIIGASSLSRIRSLWKTWPLESPLRAIPFTAGAIFLAGFLLGLALVRLLAWR
jgi:serine/threonine-protein kinase